MIKGGHLIFHWLNTERATFSWRHFSHYFEFGIATIWKVHFEISLVNHSIFIVFERFNTLQFYGFIESFFTVSKKLKEKFNPVANYLIFYTDFRGFCYYWNPEIGDPISRRKLKRKAIAEYRNYCDDVYSDNCRVWVSVLSE